MISRTVVLGFAAALLAAPAATVSAQTTLGSGGGSSIYTWGAEGTHAYGQTFTTPAVDNRLDSFSFWLGAVPSTNFKGYVYSWDATNSQATGPALFSSAVQSGPSGDGYTRVDILTGGLNLASGSQYVAFLGADDLGGSGSDSWESTGANGDGDATSNFVYLNSNSASDYTTAEWTTCHQGCGSDLRYEMTFNSAVVATPEPASVALLATGLVGIAGFARRRRNSNNA